MSTSAAEKLAKRELVSSTKSSRNRSLFMVSVVLMIGVLVALVAVNYRIFIPTLEKKYGSNSNINANFSYYIPITTATLAIYPLYFFLASPIASTVRGDKASNVLLTTRIMRVILATVTISLAFVLPFAVLYAQPYELASLGPLKRIVKDSTTYINLVSVSGTLLLILLNLYALRRALSTGALIAMSAPKVTATAFMLLTGGTSVAVSRVLSPSSPSSSLSQSEVEALRLLLASQSPPAP